jgi:hypothetical protein
MPTSNKIAFYNKFSIVFFSIVLTGFVGALMMGYNLRAVGKNKLVLPLVLTALFGAFAVRLIFEKLKILPEGLINLLISNVVMGLILAIPVWKSYLGEYKPYDSKPPLIPAIVTVIIYGGIALVFFIRK